MELAAHGTYNLKIADSILYVDAHGPFNEITTQQYAQDIKKYYDEFHHRNWTSLTTFYGNSIFTPEAEKSLISILRDRENDGLLANASIILESHCSDLQYMQLKRIYEKANIAFSIFNDVKSAEKWLGEFICSPAMQKAQ